MKAKLGKIWTDSVAYVMLISGAGLSTLFNVINTLTVRRDQVDWVDWVIAIAAPVLVVGMVEMFVNARWTGQPWYMQALRWAGTVAIGGVAMRVSWTHGHELLLSRGQTADVATLFPLSIDLLAIMATALILSGRVVQDTPELSTPLSTAVDRVFEDKDTMTVDTWRDEVTQDTPVDGRPTWQDLVAAVQDTDIQWTEPADTPPLGVSIPDALPSWLDGLADRTGGGSSVQAAPLPPVVPGRTAGRLTAADRQMIRSLAAVGREVGLYTVGEIRELLAAWYEVSVKTIQRAEVS